MSLSEESELHDLVKQTLEKSGSMSKLRAELRASVFLALEENGCFENLKTKNNLLQELAKDSDGLLLLSLIREFLDYYGLSFTASVFDPELASYGIECDCKDYMKLGSQLKLTSDYSNKKKGPLLYEMMQVIRNFQHNQTQKSNNLANAEEHSQLHTSKSTDSSTEYYQLQPVSSPPEVRTTVKFKEADFDDGINRNIKLTSTKFNNNVSSSPTTLGRESDSSRYSLSSLGDLPPLSSQNNPNKNVLSPSNNSSKHMHKLKAMLMDPTLSDNNEDQSNSSIITDDEKENDRKVYDDGSGDDENMLK